MATIKRLQILILVLLVILGILTAKILTSPPSPENTAKINLNQALLGNFSRALLAVQGRDLVVTWDNQEKSIPLREIAVSYHRQFTGKDDLRINFEKLSKILEELAPAVKKEPIDAKLEYFPSENRIKEFSLPQNGRRLNIGQSAETIAKNLAKAQLSIALVLETTPPKITLNSLSQLGITALLAHGESDFKGSPPNRIHNIGTGAAKFQGLILKPGEEFSFNAKLGKVQPEEGYLAELVIKNRKVTPEYGGGLCQVSTTLFRAAVASGLPILERHPHSFPVHYYHPQGFDATIYPGSADLRFKNDTAKNILIQDRLEGTKLIFEIFGSPDGRQVELSLPKIIEQNSDGSLKTILTRKIFTVDGTTKTDSFWSNYHSPALFPLERNPLE